MEECAALMLWIHILDELSSDHRGCEVNECTVAAECQWVKIPGDERGMAEWAATNTQVE